MNDDNDDAAYYNKLQYKVSLTCKIKKKKNQTNKSLQNYSYNLCLTNAYLFSDDIDTNVRSEDMAEQKLIGK